MSSDASTWPAAGASPGARWRALEGPTWLLIAAVYGAWLALTWLAGDLPWWLVAPLGGWVVAWHGSLQHELIHGHPTRHAAINAAMAWPPLCLWLPYPLYRDSHLRHHDCAALTEPRLDPESYYVTAAEWQRAGPLRRAWLQALQTLAGRLILGPPHMIWRFAIDEARQLVAGRHWGIWIAHALSVAPLLWWLEAVCGIGVAEYLLLFVYPGLALTMLRSFAEHRRAADQSARTVTVEGGGALRLLFLNLNYHALHHDRPGLPWFDLHRLYAAQRATAGNPTGPCTIAGGYGAIAARWLLSPRDHPAHSA